jgi:hypothetical protein
MTIALYLSGGAANASPSSSIGGAKSSVQASSNLIGPFVAAKFISGYTCYRCVYVTTDANLASIIAWITTETPSSDTTVAIGWGAASKNETETVITDETTAPADVTFSSPSTELEAISGADLGAGEYRALWLRYVITATDPITIESFTIGLKGSTADNPMLFNNEQMYFNGELMEYN